MMHSLGAFMACVRPSFSKSQHVDASRNTLVEAECTTSQMNSSMNDEDNPCQYLHKWWLLEQIEFATAAGCQSCKIILATLERFYSTSESSSDSDSDFDDTIFVRLSENTISIRDVEHEDLTIDIDFFVKESHVSQILGRNIPRP
jgi:hypothetical protein